MADFSGRLVSPAQGHSWSSRGTLFSLTLWALSALWQGRAHGQVTPGLGWTVFAEFFMHPSHAARLRAPGWVRVQRTAPQDPHLPPGVTQWEPRSWGTGRPQASTRPHVPSRSEALQRAAAGSLACPVLPQSLQTAGRPMETQTGLLPSCWRCHGTQDKDSWEFNGQRPQCLRQSLGCVRVLSPVRALSGGGGCSRGRLGQWGSGSRSQPSCHPDSEQEAELREELMAEFSSRRRPLT